MDAANAKALASKTARKQAETIRRLESHLRDLQERVARAREDLAAGEGLDSNLIVNAGGLSGLIAEYNLLRDLAPYTNPSED